MAAEAFNFRILLGSASFCLRNDCGKCRLIVDRQLAEHLAVHLDTARRKRMDQLRVLDVMLAAGRSDAGYPESSEFALLGSAISEGILPRFHDLLVSSLEYVFLTPEITLGLANDLLVALPRARSTLYSWHLLSFTSNMY